MGKVFNYFVEFISITLIGIFVYNTSLAQVSNKKDIGYYYKELMNLSLKLDNLNESDNPDLNKITSIENNITNINKKIVLLLISHKRINQESFFNGIKHNTDIKIVRSKNDKLIFYSWGDGLNNADPDYINVMDYITSDNKRIVKLFNGQGINKKNSSENNLSIDSIYEYNLNNKNIYFVCRSGKCGNICINESLIACEITNDSLVENLKLFNDKDRCYNELHFNYLTNENIKKNLHFNIDNKKKIVYVPIFNDDGSILIGRKSYFIAFCR